MKYIALVEWHWIGHHPTFFAHFVIALEDLGFHVLAICPQPAEACKNVAALRKFRSTFDNSNEKTIYRYGNQPEWRFQRIRPARIRAIDWTLRHYTGIERRIKEWEVESGARVDFVFYACIYDWEFEWFMTIHSLLHRSWSGLSLYVTPLRKPGSNNPVTGRVLPLERIFQGARCKGAAMLDEGMASSFSRTINKPVVVFPDLTDERLPERPRAVALENRLKQFAGARPIVGLFGYLMKSKGVSPFAMAARHPSMANTCFALAGEVAWSSFPPGDAKIILDVLTNCENIWYHLLRIPDGLILNSLMSACDVLCASYLDFPHSSNIMTKAAFLRKPLIVSDGYLMAERVRRFRMGEVVPEGDIDALVNAVAKITKSKDKWIEENQPRWEDYSREHSFERLKEAFGELLANV